MQQNVIDILLTDPQQNDGGMEMVLGRELARVRSAQEIDGQSDLLILNMEDELRNLDDTMRRIWKATWCAPSRSERTDAALRLGELKFARQRRRELYGFGMDCIGVLRTNHIEVLKWAIDRQSNASSAGHSPPDAEQFCRSFSIELEDGTEVIPVRVRDATTGLRSFKVSGGGNRNEDALLVGDEDEMCRYVIGVGYRVRCKTRDGTRTGLYTARPPNRVRERE
jgi:hypothetical protein